MDCVLCQDYEVGEIECSFGDVIVDTNRRINERLSAVLKKPEGFRGAPIFADYRSSDSASQDCQIRPDLTDRRGLLYKLDIKDLKKCGVTVNNVSPGGRR